MIDLRPRVRGGVGAPLVALETAVLTHGLPGAQALEAVRRMTAAVRAAEAVPAVVGCLRGRLVVGLEDDELAELAADPEREKVAARDLAPVLAAGRSGGTTVSATLAACRLAGIPVFATGGIGGVHRGWNEHRDVSSDLEELARTPCCVVSSGAKSVLDLPATLESLESLGIPVLGLGCSGFPRFHCGPDPALPIRPVADVEEAARICRLRWRELGQSGGVLLANPVPAAAALPAETIEEAVDRAVAEAGRRGIAGPALTPFLLESLASATGGAALACNLALLENNAAAAGRLAVALASG
ncbi:MAG: pseudouridine-5'-phosphate glycosidase [Planctomycetota bacterium]|nr:MAG: pseudouridine-5'-phosphate glycosidase [Planctomycetota bacterium]